MTKKKKKKKIEELKCVISVFIYTETKNYQEIKVNSFVILQVCYLYFTKKN